ncbi:MAG: CAP domain-containing protein [Thermoanaerobaculia bacterium]|jgi:uncharacterized protein YkwD
MGPTAALGLQSSTAAPKESTDTRTTTEQAPQAFLEAINQLRLEEQSSPLRLSEPLSQAARILLDRALLGSANTHFDAQARLTREDLRSSGYEPNQFVDGLASSSGDPVDLIAFWWQSDPKSLEVFLDSGLREFGLAAEAWPNQSIYALVAATSQVEINQPFIEQLSDLETVRQQLLDRVNEERARRHRGPLRPSRALDLAAQTYAERMMREEFYGHISPRGDTVLERVQASGYEPELTGENLASGQPTADQAMANWMASKGHRDNILDHRFQDIGFGVSALESEGELKILWVQCFGRRRP